MRVGEALSGLTDKIKMLFTAPGGGAFTCGDCERWQRCGMRPGSACIPRAAQIEDRLKRPVKRRLQIDW